LGTRKVPFPPLASGNYGRGQGGEDWNVSERRRHRWIAAAVSAGFTVLVVLGGSVVGRSLQICKRVTAESVPQSGTKSLQWLLLVPSNGLRGRQRGRPRRPR